MTEDTEMPNEHLFRAAKRRKVFRKRGLDDPDRTASATTDVADASAEPQLSSDGEEVQTTSLQSVRRPGPRRYGIGFSNLRQHDAHGQDGRDDMSLVPVTANEMENVAQVDRFVKPTGRVGMAEDKHLTAYIDSKLAELRSSQPTSITEQSETREDSSTDVAGKTNFLSEETRSIPGHEHRSTAVMARQATSRNPRKAPRRGPKIRDSTSLARDGLIDQIFGESQIPMYDSTTPVAGFTLPDQPTGDDVDIDEAAEKAFKAAFLADRERTNRRRPPKPVTGNARATQQAQSSGPKLGGSRSQREKMRAAAAEEAAKNGKPSGVRKY